MRVLVQSRRSPSEATARARVFEPRPFIDTSSVRERRGTVSCRCGLCDPVPRDRSSTFLPVLRKNAKIELLRGVPLFSACSKKQLSEVAGLAEEVVLPEGTVLIREGEPGRSFFVLVDGTVEVRRKGRRLPARGDTGFFGEISLFMRYPTTATVTACSPVRALVMTPEAFRRLLNEFPGIQRRILLALAQRLAPDTL